MTAEPIPEEAVTAAKAVIIAKDIEFCGDEEYPPTLTDIGADEMTRAALEAAAPALRAQALRDAADDIERRSSEHALIVAADKWGGYYGGVRAAAQNEAANLRARADEMEAK